MYIYLERYGVDSMCQGHFFKDQWVMIGHLLIFNELDSIMVEELDELYIVDNFNY